MDHNSDIAEFLTTRRAKILPEQAGLPSYGQRRLPGLLREEVASLAGVTVEYYKRLERGNASGVSDLVLEDSPGRFSSTTANARTSSTSSAPPDRRDSLLRSGPGPSSSGSDPSCSASRQLPAADTEIDTATLDRIDETVRPGVNLNPADTSYGEQVLQPALRRR